MISSLRVFLALRSIYLCPFFSADNTLQEAIWYHVRRRALKVFLRSLYADFSFDLIGRIALLENKKAEIEAEIDNLRNPPPKGEE